MNTRFTPSIPPSGYSYNPKSNLPRPFQSTKPPGPVKNIPPKPTIVKSQAQPRQTMEVPTMDTLLTLMRNSPEFSRYIDVPIDQLVSDILDNTSGDSILLFSLIIRMKSGLQSTPQRTSTSQTISTQTTSGEKRLVDTGKTIGRPAAQQQIAPTPPTEQINYYVIDPEDNDPVVAAVAIQKGMVYVQLVAPEDILSAIIQQYSKDIDYNDANGHYLILVDSSSRTYNADTEYESTINMIDALTQYGFPAQLSDALMNNIAVMTQQ